MEENTLIRFLYRGMELLKQEDACLYHLLVREHQRQMNTLTLIAASSLAHPSVFASKSSIIGNLTTEGYVGKRFHSGCKVADEIEQLAIERARCAFGAAYANVQPHSGTSANQIVLFSVLKAGDPVLGLGLNSGGHLTHGAKASVAGQYFHALEYGVDCQGFIDYNQVRDLAHTHRPKLIVAGASSYPRTIDFKVFREIADEVGALLLADISHISGLVVAGVHPSPIQHAHFTTTSTYKQLYGPRGGLILMGRDAEALVPGRKITFAQLIQKSTFPYFQGTPGLDAIAAKARALALVTSPTFKAMARRIVANARALACSLQERGYRVLTGGTDNHMVLIDILTRGLTGLVAEKALEECNIIVNRNRIPGDQKPALVASGLRLGTNSVALMGMQPEDMETCAELVDRVLTSVRARDDWQYQLDHAVQTSALADVQSLCTMFPIPDYV